MQAIDLLKFNLREKDSPFFSDDLLYDLLEKNGNDVDLASYEGLIMKAESDSISLPGGLSIPDNREYWLTLASRYKQISSRGMVRSDDV